jgi:two-component system, NarL family, nitrate/nitrite response regulator NarL
VRFGSDVTWTGDDTQSSSAGAGVAQRRTVMVADHQLPTRVGTRLALEASGFAVVAEAGTADEAEAAAREHEPQLCLLADDLAGGGLSAVERIAIAVPSTRIAVLTTSESPASVYTAFLLGADGFLLKTVDPDRLSPALSLLLDGHILLPRAVKTSLVAEFRRIGIASTYDPQSLTTRERQVLQLLRTGLSTAAVADRLGVSPVTVRRHASNGRQKLGEPDERGKGRVSRA